MNLADEVIETMYHNQSCHLMNVLILVCALCSFSSCVSREESFTAGRIERLCEASLPICNTRVTCSADEDTYLTGAFPGAERAMVYAPHPLTTVTLSFLIDKQIFPGTEMLVRAHQIGCVEIEEKRLVDVDIFQRAGDDRILSFSFDLEGRGDHLIEWFSDATATYVFTVDYKQREE
jgi:hypothetical protein